MDETLAEKTENVDIRNPAIGEKSMAKKKVRLVKKIVKKTIIKKVPKRVSVASNCNDLGKVTSPNPNVNANPSVEIEKPNFDINGLREAENVKMLVVSDNNRINYNDLGKVVSPNPNVNTSVEIGKANVDINGLKEAENVKMLVVSDNNRINYNDLGKVVSPNPNVNASVEIGKANVDINGLREAENVKMLEVSDNNRINCNVNASVEIGKANVDVNGLKEAEDVKMLEVSDQSRIELQDSDQNRIELRVSLASPNPNVNSSMEIERPNVDINGLQEVENVEMLEVSDNNRIELQDSDKNIIELQDIDQNRIGLQNNNHNRSALLDSDQNQIELVDREHDINTMNVKEHEGEECVKEVLVNNETDALKSQEVISESKVPSVKMVASRLHMKHMKKIFIHGLGQETKEDDIRKVFEEAGEVVDVKLITNFRSGKNRGCGFIIFASVELASLALTKYQNVEICGQMCHTTAIEGIHTILLNNIDKKWKNENVVRFLQKTGIKKIDEVLVEPDPNNAELNCGFAFLEFETKKEAQMAYHKLQNENVSGKYSNIKVSWASRFVDPVQEETHNIKSIYAENIPLSWDEKEVNDHFKMFGEIESIALAKNLRTTKRNDFAFINYKTREAALSCIEALTCKKSTANNGTKGNLKVSLSKSIPKVKPVKTISDSAVTKVSKPYQKANSSRQSQNQYQNTYQSRQSQKKLPSLGVYNLPQKLKIMIGKHEDSRKDLESSTTAELVQLLREQASWKHGGPSSTAGHHQPQFGGKQPFTEQGSQSLYHHDPRAYHQSHLQLPNVTHHRPVTNVTSFPHYDQQRAHYASGAFNFPKPDPRHIQTRDQTTYPGSSSAYRKMH